MIKAEFFDIINKSFLKMQKLVVVFVLFLFLLNNFIPKGLELKNSFMLALNCAVNTMEVNFVDKYNSVVNIAVKNIFNTLNIQYLSQTETVNNKENKSDNTSQVPVNTSADNCIIMQNNINDQMETLKANLNYLVYESTNKLYTLYESIKISCNKETSTMGILFFILFSILVVRIKDTIAVILNKYRILNRLA